MSQSEPILPNVTLADSDMPREQANDINNNDSYVGAGQQDESENGSQSMLFFSLLLLLFFNLKLLLKIFQLFKVLNFFFKTRRL